MRSSSEHPRCRWIATLAAGALLFGGLMSARGLISCTPQAATPAAAKTRPVTAAEAARLAAVRLTDYRTGHAGIRATIGSGASAIRLSGWVDWRAPFVYLNVIGPDGSAANGLIQASPGVVAVRPGRIGPTASAAAGSPYPPPPQPPPPTGWQVRPAQPTQPIDTLITLLFALRASAADDAATIQSIGTRFVATDEIHGVPVDVIDGTAVPPAPTPSPDTGKSAELRGSQPGPDPSASPAFAQDGGQVRYWVDAHSRLLRAAALINATTEAQIDFDPSDLTVPQPIEPLGGPAIDPPK